MVRNRLAQTLLCLAVICVPYTWLSRKLWFVCDDAYISFRYASNFANGDGLRFNLGDHTPVEGYSNLLWVLVASIFEATGSDTPFWMPWVSFSCGLGLVVYVFWVARTYWASSSVIAALTTLLLSTSGAFCMWATGGLATMPLALLTFALFERLVFSRSRHALYHAIVIGILLTLVRTEGFGWVVVIGAIAAWVRHGRPSDGGPPIWRFFAPALGALGLMLLWRYTTYGALLANTASAKVHHGVEYWIRGAKYVASFWLTMMAPPLYLLAAPVAIRTHGRVGLGVALMAVAFPCYSMVVGGDFMPMGRFLIPGLPFAALLMGPVFQAGWSRGWASRAGVLAVTGAAIIVQILPVTTSLPLSLASDGERYELRGGMHLVPRTVRQKLHFRFRRPNSDLNIWRNMKRRPARWAMMGQMMARGVEPDASVVRASVGAFGYYSNLFIYDKYGLVSRNPHYEMPEDDGSKHTIAPGHDQFTPQWRFLPLAPTVLEHKHIVDRDKMHRVKKTMKKWGLQRDRAVSYAPVLLVEPAGDPGAPPEVILLLHRVADAAEWGARWSAYDRDRDALSTLQNASDWESSRQPEYGDFEPF
jgi:hypothetical protein